jgi:hypothetical protein
VSWGWWLSSRVWWCSCDGIYQPEFTLKRSIIFDVNETVLELAVQNGPALPDEFSRRLREALMRLPPHRASEKPMCLLSERF